MKDAYDYSMSDTFVSETRRIPYRTGFRARQYRGRLPIKKVNALNDHDFRRYCQNGCRFPDPEQDLRDQLAEQRELIRVQALHIKQNQDALRVQALQLQELRSLLPLKHPQASARTSSGGGSGSHSVRGLDVPRR
ncbi:MAG: hypothetical protein HOP00_05460 [Nitrospira sp.]|nr:hypothetical protein [Nitrospira sp.]